MAQLRLFKALSVVLAVLLLGLLGLYVYKQRQVQPVAVLVNGRQIAVAINAQDATSVLAGIKASRSRGFPWSSNPQIVEQITFRRLPVAGAVMDSEDSLHAKLAAAVHVTVKAAVIEADNTPLAALPSDAMAHEALAEVKKHYAQMPPNDVIEAPPAFREHVSVVDTRAPTTLARPTVEDAVTFLITPPPPQTYTVQNRDTGWKIARKMHINMIKFVAMNRAIDLNKLHIGDTVNISGGAPPLTVIVVKRSQVEEAIRPGAPPDAAGRRRLDTETTYIDGAPSGTPTTISVETLQRARPARSLE